MRSKILTPAASLAMVLALFVVMLGAYTRLTNAGLGCPDWPGCYGQMILPKAQASLDLAQKQYPQLPIEADKAWTEMTHRYAAGTLALLIFFIAMKALKTNFLFKMNPQIDRRLQVSDALIWKLPLVMLLLLFAQAALGMWTVTLKLLPVVVMAHLLGGIILFSCLSYYRFQISKITAYRLPQWRVAILLAIAVLFGQIALGGWVTANYAGIACIGFPRCNGQWIPHLELSQGFNLFSLPGINYQGGVLTSETRATIQFIHRLGALMTATYLTILALLMFFKIKIPFIKKWVLLLMLLLIIQFALGVLNVIYLLPLPVAVAHNGVAAMLMATLFVLFYLTQGGRVDTQ